MQNELIGIGNALLDFQLEVPDSVLTELKIKKGSMNLVDADYQLRIFSELHQRFGRDHFEVNSGGSAANTLAGFANLGGKAHFVGKLGRDDNAREYHADLQRVGIAFDYTPHAELPTGTCLALITPDAERTMLTHLGAAIDLNVKDLPTKALQASKILYLEGYLWDSRTAREACLEAAQVSRSSGMRVAMTFSDAFCVERHHDSFMEMLRNNVDILFCNETEAQMAAKNKDTHEAFKILSRLCPVVAVSTGPRGALLSENFGKHCTEVETWDVPLVDKLGAGDLFAAGVLYGLIRERPLQEAGYLGCYSATRVIQQMSGRLKEDLSKSVSQACRGPRFAQATAAEA